MVRTVKKLWESMRKSLWGNGGKICTFGGWNGFYTFLRNFLHTSSDNGGKICRSFTHGDNRYRDRVLHIFHIAYYYNY